MAVGHVQKRQLALGGEAQQILLADGLLGRRAGEPASATAERGGGAGYLQEFAAAEHPSSRGGEPHSTIC